MRSQDACCNRCVQPALHCPCVPRPRPSSPPPSGAGALPQPCHIKGNTGSEGSRGGGPSGRPGAVAQRGGRLRRGNRARRGRVCGVVGDVWDVWAVGGRVGGWGFETAGRAGQRLQGQLSVTHVYPPLRAPCRPPASVWALRPPPSAPGRFDRGNIRMRLEDWGGALTDFRTAADLAPGLAGAHIFCPAWVAAPVLSCQA